MAELSIYVPALKRKVTARETGSNKKSASKSCALSLVRQLFHLKVIEPFSGTLKKKKDEELKPYPVKLAPELVNSIDEVIQVLDLPVVNPRNIKMESDGAPIPLIVSAPKLAIDLLYIKQNTYYRCKQLVTIAPSTYKSSDIKFCDENV